MAAKLAASGRRIGRRDFIGAIRDLGKAAGIPEELPRLVTKNDIKTI